MYFKAVKCSPISLQDFKQVWDRPQWEEEGQLLRTRSTGESSSTHKPDSRLRKWCTITLQMCKDSSIKRQEHWEMPLNNQNSCQKPHRSYLLCCIPLSTFSVSRSRILYYHLEHVQISWRRGFIYLQLVPDTDRSSSKCNTSKTS